MKRQDRIAATVPDKRPARRSAPHMKEQAPLPGSGREKGTGRENQAPKRTSPKRSSPARHPWERQPREGQPRERQSGAAGILSGKASIIAFVTVGSALALAYNHYVAENGRASALAAQADGLHRLAEIHVRSHYGEIAASLAALPSGQALVLTPSDLRAAGHPEALAPDSNIYEQDYRIRIRENAQGWLDIMLVMEGGRDMPESIRGQAANRLGLRAYRIREDGSAATGDERRVLQVPGPALPEGRLLLHSSFDPLSHRDSPLYRHPIPGRPDLQRMEQDIEMGGLDVRGARNVEANRVRPLAWPAIHGQPCDDPGRLSGRDPDGRIASCEGAPGAARWATLGTVPACGPTQFSRAVDERLICAPFPPPPPPPPPPGPSGPTACSPQSPQTRQAPCINPAKVGYIIEQRTHSCPGGWSGWAPISFHCSPAGSGCTPQPPIDSTGACPPGQQGSVTLRQTHDCGSGSWSAPQVISSTCAPPACDPQPPRTTPWNHCNGWPDIYTTAQSDFSTVTCSWSPWYELPGSCPPLGPLPGEEPNCCFLPDSPVPLADGRSARIGDIVPGTAILSGYSSPALARSRRRPGKANRMKRHIMARANGRKLIGLNGLAPYFTPDHPFLGANGRWYSHDIPALRAKYPDFERVNGSTLLQLETGIRLAGLDGPVIVERIDAIEVDPDQVVIDLELDGDHSFFVHGLAVHNGHGDY